MPENEALRRRIMEMEILLSRQGCQVPDELKVLQAENCHFRDLTFARLAEVEYWKKMYAKERSNNEERLEALRREYQKKIEDELWRLKQQLEDPSRFNAEKDEIHKLYRFEIGKLKDKHQEELARYMSPLGENIMQKDLDALMIENETLKKTHSQQIAALKEKMRLVMKEEILKMTREHTNTMVDLRKENKALISQINIERHGRDEEDKKKLESVIKIIKSKEEEFNNLSRSQHQQNIGDSKLAVAYEELKKQNEELKNGLKDIVHERDEMFQFVVDRLDEKRTEKADILGAMEEFQNKFATSPGRETYMKFTFQKSNLNAIRGLTSQFSNDPNQGGFDFEPVISDSKKESGFFNPADNTNLKPQASVPKLNSLDAVLSQSDTYKLQADTFRGSNLDAEVPVKPTASGNSLGRALSFQISQEMERLKV